MAAKATSLDLYRCDDSPARSRLGEFYALHNAGGRPPLIVVRFPARIASKLWNLTIPANQAYALGSERCVLLLFSNPARDYKSVGVTMDQENKSKSPKLGWTLEELACSLSVSVPFLRLEVKRGRLKAAHLGRRVVLLDRDVQRYLAEASDRAA
jgi:hypothetical protein